MKYNFVYGKCLLAFWLILQSSMVFAHAPGLSAMELALKVDALAVKVTFALQDIEAFTPMDADLDAEVTDAEREAAKPSIAKLIAEQLRITVDGQELTPIQSGQVAYDDNNNAHVEFQYHPLPHQVLLVQSKFLALLPDSHQQFVTIKDSAGKTLIEKMLHKNDDQISLSLTETDHSDAELTGFNEFYSLGIEHILTGYDHLLFLFALLAVTHSFWPAIKIITFFTIAHSITLACAVLNIIELPSSVVEPIIALTIIYVSLENVFRGEHPKGRQWLTFGFGLMHGFGFASVLREMDIASSDTGILIPLLSFNLGIESGQIAVAILVLPIIWQINNKLASAEKLLKGVSFLISLMGVYWLLERTVL